VIMRRVTRDIELTRANEKRSYVKSEIIHIYEAVMETKRVKRGRLGSPREERKAKKNDKQRRKLKRKPNVGERLTVKTPSSKVRYRSCLLIT
jgi:hypothetical protein